MSKKTLSNLIIVVILVGVVWGVSVVQRSARATSLLADMQKPDDYEAYKAMRKINSLGPSALLRAVPLLSANQPYVRARAATLVGEAGNPIYADAEENLLRDHDDAVREAAATALGHLGGPAAAPRLVELLQDETQPLEVRTAAARSLGLLASPEAAPNLIALLQAPPDPKQAALREALTAALGTVKSPAAVTELISLIQPAEKDVTVRTLAAEALGHASALDKDRMILAVTALIQVLIARDPTGKQVTPSEVRIAAAHALGGMACPPEMAGAVHEGLRTAIINDDEYWVRLAAKQALG